MSFDPSGVVPLDFLSGHSHSLQRSNEFEGSYLVSPLACGCHTMRPNRMREENLVGFARLTRLASFGLGLAFLASACGGGAAPASAPPSSPAPASAAAKASAAPASAAAASGAASGKPAASAAAGASAAASAKPAASGSAAAV